MDERRKRKQKRYRTNRAHYHTPLSYLLQIIFRALTYNNLFIAACAVLMTWETQYLFFAVDAQLLLFVCFATLATYFFHGLVNTVYPPESAQHEWNKRYRVWIFCAMIISLGVTVYAGWPFRTQPLPFLAVAIAAFLYTAPNIPWKIFRSLQVIAMGKTVYLAAVWTIVTTMLPMWLRNGAVPEPFWWFLGHRFFLLLAICILFDQRDVLPDQEKGVRSMATMTHTNTLRMVFYVSLVLAGIMAFGIDLSLANPWLIPVLLLSFQFSKTNHPRPEAYYAIFLDGMMACTALIHAIMSLGFLR